MEVTGGISVPSTINKEYYRERDINVYGVMHNIFVTDFSTTVTKPWFSRMIADPLSKNNVGLLWDFCGTIMRYVTAKYEHKNLF